MTFGRKKNIYEQVEVVRKTSLRRFLSTEKASEKQKKNLKTTMREDKEKKL